ncbi:MAG: hypothetical protein ABL967_07960 [Bryobacteraceae bacterium]
MSEKELKREISHIFQQANSTNQAMVWAGDLLGREFGEVRLLQGRPLNSGSAFGEPAVAQFLESREFPFRGVYTAASGRTTVILLLGSWGAPRRSMQIFADHIAAQLHSANVRSEVRRSEAA